MKTQITILVIILICSCSSDHSINKEMKTKSANDVNNEEADFEAWNYKEVKQDFFSLLMYDICSTQDVEFIDLYPVMDSIANDEYERIILVDSLKSKGFKVTDWSRGNWMHGPRFVSLKMNNGHCKCQVDKLYYSTESDHKYKVTERIKCETDDE